MHNINNNNMNNINKKDLREIIYEILSMIEDNSNIIFDTELDESELDRLIYNYLDNSPRNFK